MTQQTNNAGCRSCRYHLQTVSECLKENRKGELMRDGLIGQCSEFKEIQAYPTRKESALDGYLTPRLRE